MHAILQAIRLRGAARAGGSGVLRVTVRAGRSEPAQARLTLPYEARQKRRLRARLDDGREIALLLERGPFLRAGDRLRAEDGSIIEVTAEPESVSRAQSDDPWLLARACYHLGNRHVPLAIESGCVRYPLDHVLDALALKLGLRVSHAVEPFEPEAGAYASAGDAPHVHSYSASHAHAHADPESEAHAHTHAHAHTRAEDRAETPESARPHDPDPGTRAGAKGERK